MGYPCPVCAAPQADVTHLANHLAFSAVLGHDDHERWLDEHVPDWDHEGPDELGSEITEYVEETDYADMSAEEIEGETPPVIDERPTPSTPDDSAMDPEARRILDEARRMTESMRDEDADE